MCFSHPFKVLPSKRGIKPVSLGTEAKTKMEQMTLMMLNGFTFLIFCVSKMHPSPERCAELHQSVLEGDAVERLTPG